MCPPVLTENVLVLSRWAERRLRIRYYSLFHLGNLQLFVGRTEEKGRYQSHFASVSPGRPLSIAYLECDAAHHLLPLACLSRTTERLSILSTENLRDAILESVPLARTKYRTYQSVRSDALELTIFKHAQTRIFFQTRIFCQTLTPFNIRHTQQRTPSSKYRKSRRYI